ncbi:MAG: capsular biosynthesis protein [Arenimonas sp.]
MICEGLSAFKGRRILLLQGPVGPFFRRLAKDLQQAGAFVHKINFNGGDWAFYSENASNFRGHAKDWPAYFENFLAAHEIDMVLLFGDCRPLHRAAHEIATRKNIEIGVFEEGYVRPDYVTLELRGVNGNSTIPRDPRFYTDATPEDRVTTHNVGNTFWYAALWAILYYTASTFSFPFFHRYQHHRPLGILEGLPWVRSAWRKMYYKIAEKGIEQTLTGRLSKQYFLAPLQVHNDSQVQIHSNFESISKFIERVIQSFAKHAPNHTYLVIKHHPMDRAYRDYNDFIGLLASTYRIENRVLYIHDQHLPSLLTHARGVVVINSTVGLSALNHATPLKVCGNAIYDMQGLTFQASLGQFWRTAHIANTDNVLLERFLNYLITNTQLNGSFYRRLNFPFSHAGLVWTTKQSAKVSSLSEQTPIAKPEIHLVEMSNN